MATQKDFIPMAASLKEVGDRIKRNMDIPTAAHERYTWMECCRTVATSFACGNHRFKTETFLDACGYYEDPPERDPVTGLAIGGA